MVKTLFVIMLTVAAASAAPAAQQQPSSPADAGVLATVTIPRAVLAGGQPLAAGTYQLRFAAGQPPAASDAQRRVEFVSNGTVVAREVAEVLRDDDLPATGDSARPAAQGVRVEMLKGDEFLRISVKRGTVRYLVHLPVPR